MIDNSNTPVFYDRLDLVFNEIINDCNTATQSRKHELHQLYLSTFGAKYPEVRTVVFRRHNIESGNIFFHTDRRSKKVIEIQNNPSACLLGYNSQKKYQIRFRGKIELHIKDDVARSAWKNIGASSRRCYLTQNAPGTHVSSPTSGLIKNHELSAPTFEESEDGFDKFTVCHFLISEIEWLFLHSNGHRRAIFYLQNNSEWKSQWLQP